MFPFQFLNLFFAAARGEEQKERKHDISAYKRGDLLAVPRTIFTHFGIYLGDDKVAHLIPDILPILSKNQNAIKKMVTNLRLILGVMAKVATIRVDSVEDFAYGAEIVVNQRDMVCGHQPLDNEEVARRAEKLLGSITYSILWYNCEHYVMHCRYGSATSFQTAQFCHSVRGILFSERSAFLAAILGFGTTLYLGSMTAYTALPTLLLPFALWIAS